MNRTSLDMIGQPAVRHWQPARTSDPAEVRDDRHTVTLGLLNAAEFCVWVLASVVAGMLLRQTSDVPHWGEIVVIDAIAVTVAQLLASRHRLGTMQALLNPFGYLSELLLCVAYGAVAAATALVLLHGPGSDTPYLVDQPAAWALCSGAAVLSFRATVGWHLQGLARSGRLARRVAIIGATQAGAGLVEDITRDPSLRVVGIFDDRLVRRPADATAGRPRGTIGDLIALARRDPIDCIVIALPGNAADRIAGIRRHLMGIAIDIYVASEHGPMVCVARRPIGGWGLICKDIFDRIAALVLAVIAAPLLLAIALAVRLDSPGPILFRQEREGLNGIPFTMLKFRTMYSRRKGDEHVQATRGDRRVTSVGRWLRRFSLDELPQLYNILRGDMSLVGPRPHLAGTQAGNRAFHDVVPHYQARHRVKPGLTGWAQVQGLRGEVRTERELVDRIAQDLHYIDNWSFSLDLRILVGTALREVFSSSGRAY